MIIRMGQQVPADEVFESRISGDLDRMERAIALDTNPIDRHYLLLQLVKWMYKIRDKTPGAREKLEAYGSLHISELPWLSPFLLADFGHGHLPSIPTFEYLSRSLCEREQATAALDVWRVAVEIGYISNLEEGRAFVDRALRRARQIASKRLADPL